MEHIAYVRFVGLAHLDQENQSGIPSRGIVLQQELHVHFLHHQDEFRRVREFGVSASSGSGSEKGNHHAYPWQMSIGRMGASDQSISWLMISANHVTHWRKGGLMIRLLVGLLLVGGVTYAMMNREKVNDLKAEAMFKEEVEKVENMKRQMEQDAQERVRQIEEQTQH